MRVYSQLSGTEILRKYGLTKPIVATINSRAHRTIYPDGRLSMVEDSFSSDNDFKSIYLHNSETLFRDIENPYLNITENKIKIEVNVVRLYAEDTSISIWEKPYSLIEISNSDVSSNYRSVASYQFPLNIEKVIEILDDHTEEILATNIVDEEKFKFVIDFLKTDMEIDYTRIYGYLSAILKNFENLEFFTDGSYKEYSEFLFNSGRGTGNLSSVLEKKSPVKTIKDTLDSFKLPLSFSPLLKNAYSLKIFGKSSYTINYLQMNVLEEYPEDIQGILLYNLMHGNITIEHVSKFMQSYDSEMFDTPEIIEAFRKFLIKDFRRGSIDDFKEMHEMLSKKFKEDIPKKLLFNPKTLNFKSISSLLNRSFHEFDSQDSETTMDVFEQLLEDNALKAVKYLRNKKEGTA